MVPRKILLNVILALEIVFLVTQVHSQNVSSGGNQTYAACNASSYCTHIRRCWPYRALGDWKTVGVTCGYGIGVYRRVCCPRQTDASVTALPPPMTPVSSGRNQTYACTASSYCTQIRRCRPYRALGDWKTVGVTCGYGTGAYRRVCCPRQTDASVTAPPPPMTPDCGTNLVRPRAERSVGGTNVPEGTYPWMVAIKRRQFSRFVPSCTGFLIDSRHVLTTAGCVEDTNTDKYRLRIGNVNQDEADEYTISRITTHEDYKKMMFYDNIAVLTLSREVDFPGFVPICLPDKRIRDMDLTGYGMTVAGWGSESPRGGPSLVLQEVRGMPVISNPDCNRVFRSISSNNFWTQFPRGVSSAFLCAGFPDGKRDACGGDAGGPLMFLDRNRWFAVGIVSFGRGCGEPGIPGGYTRVASYLDWIEANTKD